MKKYIGFLALIFIIVSCGTSNNFNKRKYLNLKHKSTKVENTNTVDIEPITEEVNYSYSENEEVEEMHETVSPLESQPTSFEEKSEFVEVTEDDIDRFEPSKSIEKSALESVRDEEDEDGPEMNILALISFISLCVSIFLFPFLIVALITGLIALGQINREPGRYDNKWMALVAIWVSGVIILLTIALITLIIVLAVL